MAIHFSLKSISALQQTSLKQKQTLIALAMQKLTAPEKLALNLVKLALLVPLFLYIVWLHGWMIMLSPMGAIAAYFLIYRPIFLALIEPYLAVVIAKEHQG